METQFWLVGLSNTLHLLATVIWIGWSTFLSLAIAPRVEEAHRMTSEWPSVLLRRFTPLAYGALAILGVSGMVQMGAHPQYEGMFSFTNLWSGLLFVKHLLVLLSAALILYLGQVVTPELRLALQRKGAPETGEVPSLTHRFTRLAGLNFAAGLGVLLLTGFMTAVH